MRRWMSLGCVLALAGLGLWGCGPSNPDTDAGPDMTDGGGTDSGPVAGGDPVGFGPMIGMLTAADYSCRGMGTAPDDTGAEVAFTGAVTDFFNGMPVEGLTVNFFPDNAPTADCTGSCISGTSSAMGEVAVMDNGGSWYAYRIQSGSGMVAGAPSDYIEVVQFNEPAPLAPGSETMNAVSASTQNTILTLLAVMVDSGTATLTGLLTDCGGEAIANANIRVFDSGGEIVLGTGRRGPRAFYFGPSGSSSIPMSAQRQTNIDGLYGATNIPIPTDGRLRVELWGTTTDGGTPEMLGCEEVEAIADGLTAINVGPARMDGPSACSM